MAIGNGIGIGGTTSRTVETKQTPRLDSTNALHGLHEEKQAVQSLVGFQRTETEVKDLAKTIHGEDFKSLLPSQTDTKALSNRGEKREVKETKEKTPPRTEQKETTVETKKRGVSLPPIDIGVLSEETEKQGVKETKEKTPSRTESNETSGRTEAHETDDMRGRSPSRTDPRGVPGGTETRETGNVSGSAPSRTDSKGSSGPTKS